MANRLARNSNAADSKEIAKQTTESRQLVTYRLRFTANKAPRKSEHGVPSSQCLDRRVPDKQTLVEEVAAWEQDDNANHAKANWPFTTRDARTKLKHLYPST